MTDKVIAASLVSWGTCLQHRAVKQLGEQHHLDLFPESIFSVIALITALVQQCEGVGRAGGREHSN